jgi:hypothetical protein
VGDDVGRQLLDGAVVEEHGGVEGLGCMVQPEGTIEHLDQVDGSNRVQAVVREGFVHVDDAHVDSQGLGEALDDRDFDVLIEPSAVAGPH